MTNIKPYREITPQGRYILNLHQGQTRAWKSTARFPVISAGTQGGKTCFEPDWLRREINTCGDGDYIVVAPTFQLLDKKLLPEFKSVFCDIFKLGDYKEQKKVIQFHHVVNGNDKVKSEDSTRIIFGSADNPESVESATAKAAVLDEAGQKQFRRETWEATRRRLSLARGRALFGTTLYNAGWFIPEIYNKAINNEGGFELIQFNSIENPAFSKEEYEEARATMPAWKFAMFYQGKFLRPAGLVYDAFDAQACVVDRFPIPKEWLIYVGHDFGSANPAAMFYAVDPATGLIYAFHEYLPGQGRSTYEHVQEFKRITEGYNVVARIGGNQTSEDGWRNDFTAHGWHIQSPAPNLKSVEVQIARVYALHRLNKLKVFSDLTHYLDDLTTFSYELDDKYQPTDKLENEKDRHLLACDRYCLSSFTPETVKQITPQTKRYW
jgi:hypothetical protein